MNENTEFDLEWAKRGGVFVARDNQVTHHFDFFGFTCGLVVKRTLKKVSGYVVGDWRTFSESYTPMSMATRAECEAAGVEYIERHVGADELVELCKDRKRIDWLIEHSDMFYYHPAKCEYCVSHYFLDTTDEKVVYAKNPREAIDAAMKGEKNE